MGIGKKKENRYKSSEARYRCSNWAACGFMDAFKRLTFWLLEGTKGGPTRIRLLSLLEAKPMNMHQLAISAGMDYKSVEHHISLLEKNGLVECAGNGYGKAYFVSESVLSQKDFLVMIRGEGNGKSRKSKKN